MHKIQQNLIFSAQLVFRINKKTNQPTKKNPKPKTNPSSPTFGAGLVFQITEVSRFGLEGKTAD